MSAITPAPGLAGSAPRLSFAVDSAEALAFAAVPTLRFALRIESAGGVAVRSVLLDVQLQIAARRRPYDSAAHDRLFELFGVPRDWGTTLRTLPWTRVSVVVPPFSASTVVHVDVPCTYDLEVAASRYFHALGDGEVPLELLFGGTVFYAGPQGLLQTGMIGWDQEAEFALPVRTWKEVMERHFAGTAWLRLSSEGLDRLVAYRSRNKLASWDAVVDALLPAEEDAG
jgi:hypothetical protein